MIKLSKKEADLIHDVYREWKYDKAAVISSAVSYKIRGTNSSDTSISNLCVVLSYLNLVNLVSVLDGNYTIETDEKE